MNIHVDKFEDWLKNKNLADRTIESYIYYFNKFTDEVFTQETVSRFLSLKENRNGVARSFLVNLQKYLKANYRELGFSQELRTRIIEVELPKQTGRVKVSIVKPIPHDQIPLLEKHLETEALKLQLLLSYYCGLRLGELLKITSLSFNWEEWKDYSKWGECRVLGKGNKEGIALVPPELMKRIATFIREGNWESMNSRIFVKSLEGKEKNKGRTWQNKLKQAGIDSGITKLDEKGDVIEGTSVHPHKLRHSYGYYLIHEKKMDIRKIQELLRHSSIQSTQRYTYVDKEALKEELNA